MRTDTVTLNSHPTDQPRMRSHIAAHAEEGGFDTEIRENVEDQVSRPEMRTVIECQRDRAIDPPPTHPRRGVGPPPPAGTQR